MKKATKRIPVRFQITHPITNQVHEKVIYTNDIEKYLKSSGTKWKMIPFEKYRVWLEDSVEPDGGFWWNCYADAHGYLRQEGYKHEPSELDTLDQYKRWGYKIEKRC